MNCKKTFIYYVFYNDNYVPSSLVPAMWWTKWIVEDNGVVVADDSSKCKARSVTAKPLCTLAAPKLNTSSLCCTLTNILSGFTLPISTWQCACHGCVPSKLFFTFQLCLFEQTNDRFLYLEPTTVFSLHLRWFYVPHFY